MGPCLSPLPLGVREPVALALLDVVDVHVLGLTKCVEPFFAQLAAEPALAHAAERAGLVVRERVIHPECARLDLLHRRHHVAQVVRVDVRAQAVLAVVRQGDRLVDVTHPYDSRDRAEYLLPRRTAAMADAVEHGGLQEMTALTALGPPTTGRETRSLPGGVLNRLLHCPQG